MDTRATMMVALVAGCATSYQSATTARQLTADTWLIDASGNGYTSRGTVSNYVFTKASEVCPKGFDVVDRDASVDSRTATFDGGKTYTEINRPSSQLVVRCRGGTPTPTGHWCTSKPDGDGVCAPQPGMCEVFRSKMNEANGSSEFAGCLPLKVAICAPSGCFTTPAMCVEFERARKRDGSACVLR